MGCHTVRQPLPGCRTVRQTLMGCRTVRQCPRPRAVTPGDMPTDSVVMTDRPESRRFVVDRPRRDGPQFVGWAPPTEIQATIGIGGRSPPYEGFDSLRLPEPERQAAGAGRLGERAVSLTIEDGRPGVLEIENFVATRNSGRRRPGRPGREKGGVLVERADLPFVADPGVVDDGDVPVVEGDFEEAGGPEAGRVAEQGGARSSGRAGRGRRRGRTPRRRGRGRSSSRCGPTVGEPGGHLGGVLHPLGASSRGIDRRGGQRVMAGDDQPPRPGRPGRPAGPAPVASCSGGGSPSAERCERVGVEAEDRRVVVEPAEPGVRARRREDAEPLLERR